MRHSQPHRLPVKPSDLEACLGLLPMGQAGTLCEGPCHSSWLYADRPDGKPLTLIGAQGPDSDKVPKPQMSPEGDVDFIKAGIAPSLD
jgi:hypothetical protein